MIDFNLREIKIDEDKAVALAKKRAVSGMIEAMPVTVDIAQSIVAVRTGYLRSTIGSEVSDSDRGIIGILRAAADYAIYVEKGTSRMAAQPYLRPTVFGHPDQIIAAFLRGARS